jgi:DNA polymerase-4
MGQAKRLCPGLVIIEPHFESYSDFSQRIFAALEKVAPVIEQVSIDEAYLDFTGCERLYKDRRESALAVKQAVFKASGLTCTVAVASNKLVAKVASVLAKPDGLLVVPSDDEENFLKPLSIRKIPGLGPKTAAHFEHRGIMTCGDLASFDSRQLKTFFGDHALDLQEMARGVDDSPVDSEGERKSLSAEETFDTNIGDLTLLRERLRVMSERLGTSLRESNIEARTVGIKIRYEDFSTWVRALTLREPTSLAKKIFETAVHLLENNKQEGRSLRLLGVSTRNFVAGHAPHTKQFDFFETPEKKLKEEKIERVKDQLKRKFGDKILL